MSLLLSFHSTCLILLSQMSTSRYNPYHLTAAADELMLCKKGLSDIAAATESSQEVPEIVLRSMRVFYFNRYALRPPISIIKLTKNSLQYNWQLIIR